MAGLTPYRPTDVFAELRRDMDDVMNSWFTHAPRQMARAQSQSTLFAPLDVHETEQDFVVKLDVPGMNEKDIKVTCHGDTLTIQGERKGEHTETRGNVRYSERSFGSFNRSMTLPAHVKHDQIRARYQNGVLEVVVPKAPSATARDIKVEV